MGLHFLQTFIVNNNDITFSWMQEITLSAQNFKELEDTTSVCYTSTQHDLVGAHSEWNISVAGMQC